MFTLELMEARQGWCKIDVIFFPIEVATTSKRWRKLEVFPDIFFQESTQQIILLNFKTLDKKNVIPILNCVSA